jgi:hypothetical protein
MAWAWPNDGGRRSSHQVRHRKSLGANVTVMQETRSAADPQGRSEPAVKHDILHPPRKASQLHFRYVLKIEIENVMLNSTDEKLRAIERIWKLYNVILNSRAEELGDLKYR